MKNKNINLLTVCFVAIGMTLAGATFSPSWAGGLKIGVVNLPRIIKESSAGKAASDKLRATVGEKNATLQDKRKTFDKMQKDFNQQRLVSRPSALDEMEWNLLTKKRELELFRDNTKQFLQRSEARLTSGILKNVRKVINDYAKKNGYSAVFMGSSGGSPMGGGLLYADDAIDITDKIMKIYDEQFQGAASKGTPKK